MCYTSLILQIELNLAFIDYFNMVIYVNTAFGVYTSLILHIELNIAFIDYLNMVIYVSTAFGVLNIITIRN